ncbi:MAG: hypothetical protein AAGB04_08865 [Pseudomonadota bacterium]
MDRRTFLKSSGVAAATATGTVATQQALAAPAKIEQPIEIATALTPQFQRGYLRDRADRLALSMRSLSDGRIDVQFVEPASSGGQAVQTGQAQAYFGTESDHLSLDSSLGFFAGLPGDLGLKPDEYKSWLTAGGGQMHWDAIAGELGLKSFAAGHSGPAPGLWATTDLVLLEHVQGKGLLASGLTAHVGERLGFAITASVDTADAVEVPVGRTAAIADGLIGKSKFWLTGGLSNGGHVLSFGLNRELWERLGNSDKALIETCTSEAYNQCVSEHVAHDREVAPVLMAHRGIERRQWQDELQRAIAHASAQVVEEVAGSSKQSRNLSENYMFFRRSVTGSSEIIDSVGLV